MIEFHIPAIYIVEALMATFAVGFYQGRFEGRTLFGFPYEFTIAVLGLAVAWSFPTDATNHLTVVSVSALGAVLITTARGLGRHRREIAGMTPDQRELLGDGSRVGVGIRMDHADLKKMMDGAVLSCVVGDMPLELSLADPADTDDQNEPDEPPSWVADVLSKADARKPTNE